MSVLCELRRGFATNNILGNHYRAGAVKAAIWKNAVDKNGRQVLVFSVKISRTYKAGGEFRESDRFGPADLPRVQLVAAKAYEFLSLAGQDDAASGAET